MQRGKFGHRGAHREKAMKDEGRGAGGGNASAFQGMPKIFCRPPQARGEAWNGFFLMASERTWWQLDLECLASRTGNEHFCCFSHPICATLLHSALANSYRDNSVIFNVQFLGCKNGTVVMRENALFFGDTHWRLWGWRVMMSIIYCHIVQKWKSKNKVNVVKCSQV